MKERATNVYQLETTEQVIAFAKSLVQMKETAPRSLTIMIAITAEREVEHLGGKPAKSLVERVRSMVPNSSG
jgi:hypothetical protein